MQLHGAIFGRFIEAFPHISFQSAGGCHAVAFFLLSTRSVLPYHEQIIFELLSFRLLVYNPEITYD